MPLVEYRRDILDQLHECYRDLKCNCGWMPLYKAWLGDSENWMPRESHSSPWFVYRGSRWSWGQQTLTVQKFQDSEVSFFERVEEQIEKWIFIFFKKKTVCLMEVCFFFFFFFFFFFLFFFFFFVSFIFVDIMIIQR